MRAISARPFRTRQRLRQDMGMDGGVHGWVASCSTPPTRDEAAHEWARGTLAL